MSNPLERLFGGPPVRTLAWLALLSVMVGFVLATLGLDPVRLIHRVLFGFDDLVAWLLSLGSGFVTRLLRYLAWGAVIVVPIWLVLRMLAIGRGRA